ncbi:MAG: AMP-binding protein [Rhizomicrobium sp.]
MSGDWTIQTLVHELAGQGEKPCLISIDGDSVRRVSCASLASQVTALAWGLRESGIGPGETVGLIAPNGPDWVVARLALGCTGALVHALDDLYSEAELRIALGEAKCGTVLTSAIHVSALREIDPTCELVVLDDTPVPGTTSWRSLFLTRAAPLPAVDANAPAMLVYTSGTTGRPKAFLLTSSQLWANVKALKASRLVGMDDRVLLPLPLHHVYPFLVGILTVLSCGAVVVFPEEVGGPQILRALSLAEVSTIVGVPRLYTALVSGVETKVSASGRLGTAIFHMLLNLSVWLRRRFGVNAGRWLLASVRRRLGPRLRLLACGGALLQPEVLWPLTGLGFDVRTGYGLAETASIFTGNLPGSDRLGSEGKAFAGELRIAAAEGSAEGGEGEIQLRGPTVFSGYRNNDAANREAFTPDGWFRTGDIGHLDADGYLYVTGRIKEMIVLGGGKKVLPEDLEKHYRASPFIRELAILERGGSLVALVLPDLEAIRASGSPRVDEVIRVALSETAFALPTYERLAGYRLVREPLPKTRLGKYQRFKLAAIYDAAETARTSKPQGDLSAEDRALLESEPARSVFALLKTRYAGKPVSLDASPLLDLGIDSLEWVALALMLEQHAGVHLDESLAGESLMVRDLLRHFAEMANVPATRAGAEYEAVVQHWLKPADPLLRVVAKLLYRFNAFLMPALFRLRVEGHEHLPVRGPFVIVPNHESDLDPMLVAAALSSIELHWGGDAARLFRRLWLHPLMRALNLFPADERRPSETLAIAVEVLRRGECLVWFPESWRSPDGRLQRFLPGIGRLLTEARVPAVPAFIEGAFEAMPRNRKLPRLRPVSITFGPPQMPVDGPPQAIADRLHDCVAALEPSAEAQR